MLVRLSDLLSLQKKSKFKANFGQKSGKFKFFTCSPTQDKFIDEFIFDQESLIIGTGGAASIHYCNEPFATSTDCLVLYAKSTNNFNIKYIYYYLKGKKDVLQKGFHGSGLQHISKNYVLNITVNLPSLEQQNFIVKYFDSIENIQTNTDKCILDLELLIKSQFIEMFGDYKTNNKKWPIVKLSEISNFYNGLTYSPDSIDSNGCIVLRSSNIQNGSLDLNDIVRVNCNINKKYFVNDGDILMCSRNGSAKLVGKVAVIKNIKEPMCFGAFMMIIKSKHANYLKTYFETEYFKKQINSGISTTTINQITNAMLSKVSLPLPDEELLNKFDLFINQIDKSKIIVFIGTF